MKGKLKFGGHLAMIVVGIAVVIILLHFLFATPPQTSSKAQENAVETRAESGWKSVKAFGEFLSIFFQRQQYERIQLDDLKKFLSDEKSITIVDCREAEDYADGHIYGAINIPFRDFTDTYSNVPKADVVVTVCYVGMVSRAAAQKLSRNGYGIAKSLDGGMEAWFKAKEAVVTPERD